MGFLDWIFGNNQGYESFKPEEETEEPSSEEEIDVEDFDDDSYEADLEVMREDYHFYYDQKQRFVEEMEDDVFETCIRKACFLLIEAKRRLQNKELEKVAGYLGGSLSYFINGVGEESNARVFPEKSNEKLINDYVKDLALFINAFEKKGYIEVKDINDVDRKIQDISSLDAKTKKTYTSLRNQTNT